MKLCKCDICSNKDICKWQDEFRTKQSEINHTHYLGMGSPIIERKVLECAKFETKECGYEPYVGLEKSLNRTFYNKY